MINPESTQRKLITPIVLITAVSLVGLLVISIIIRNREQNISISHEPKAAVFVAAGVPKPFGETRNYNQIFQELTANGIQGFFPTFQYQETPQVSLGLEIDFLPPCSKDAPAYRALRENKMKFLVWGEVLYPPDQPLPSLSEDPLPKIIQCAGRENIMGIMSYDEPWWRSLLEPSKKLYKRVKTIDPALSVFMVHGPLPAVIIENDMSRSITPEEVDYYFSEVKRFQPYADIHGFDVYPIPQEVGQVTTPYARGTVVNYKTAIPDYLKWLRSNMGNKPYFIVLQAFGYDDVFPDGYLEKSTKGVSKPTRVELKEMIQLAREQRSSYIMWWGQSHLTIEDIPFWKEVLESTAGK